MRSGSFGAGRVAALAGITTFVTALALAALYVALHHGFGRGDLLPFALWDVWLALLVTAIGPATVARTQTLENARRVVVAIVIGVVTGVAFTLVVAAVLGGWFFAFSFPVLYLCAIGAAAGLVVATIAAPTGLRRDGPSSLRCALLLGGGVLVLTAATPFAMVLGAAYIWDSAEGEIHLIPNGFEGTVVIVFGDSAGAREVRQGRSRVYAIPATGILRSQFPPNHGFGNPHFYYVDARGTRRPIRNGGMCTDSTMKDSVQVCLMGQMAISGKKGPEYTGYIVSRHAARRELYDRGDSVVRAVVFGDGAGATRRRR